MSTKQREQLHSQTNVEEPDNLNSNSKLIEREKIQGTPFYVIGLNEEGWFITLGKYRITDHTETKEQAILMLENEKWNIITRIAGIMAEAQINAHSKPNQQ